MRAYVESHGEKHVLSLQSLLSEFVLRANALCWHVLFSQIEIEEYVARKEILRIEVTEMCFCTRNVLLLLFSVGVRLSIDQNLRTFPRGTSSSTLSSFGRTSY